jgi:hypothetical protein
MTAKKSAAMLFTLVFAVALLSGCTQTGNVTGDAVAEDTTQPSLTTPTTSPTPNVNQDTVTLSDVLANPSFYLGKALQLEGIVGPHENAHKEDFVLDYAFMEGGKTLPFTLYGEDTLPVSKMAKEYRAQGVVTSVTLCRCEARHQDIEGRCTELFPNNFWTDWDETSGLWEPQENCEGKTEQRTCQTDVESGTFMKEYQCGSGTKQVVYYLKTTAPVEEL